jgi:hypothetical protein
MGLQSRPTELQRSGSQGRISYHDKNVNRVEAASARRLQMPDGSLPLLTDAVSKISIADVLKGVKDAYPNTLSDSVLQHFKDN